MQWLSQVDAEARLKVQTNPEALIRLFAISRFLKNAFYPADFELTDEWESAVVLSEEGRTIASELEREGVLDSVRLAAFTMLRMFAFRDVLIDIGCDMERIVTFLSRMLHSGGVRWPYVYGHTLYDKFQDTYQGNRTDFLEADHVRNLLSGTAQGVFQVGPLLSGPLGLLESADWRIVPPTLHLPLWHCSDPGCGSLHLVKAHQYQTPTEVGFLRACRHLEDRYGPESEWSGPSASICSERFASCPSDCVRQYRSLWKGFPPARFRRFLASPKTMWQFD